MNIRPANASDSQAILALLQACGWGHRISAPGDVTELLARSQRSIVLVDLHGSVIGFARAITDELSNGYVSMVAVDPDHRRVGLGRRLIESLLGNNPGITWVLRADRPGAVEFFRSLGFNASVTAMEMQRQNQSHQSNTGSDG